MPGSTCDGQVDDDAVLERAGKRDAVAESFDRPGDHFPGGSRLELVGTGLQLLRFDVDFGACGHDVVPFVFRAVVDRAPDPVRIDQTGGPDAPTTACFVAHVLL